MGATDQQSLRERREAAVAEHVGAENRHDVEAAIAAFHRPRYEIVPFGMAIEGEMAVRQVLQGLMAAFPDLHLEANKIHHGDDAVIWEGRLTGTHAGPWAGIPATGRRVDHPVAAIFEFEEDRLVCERAYFDAATVLRQIGALPEPATA